MSPMSPWGDILTEQLRGDILIDQQHRNLRTMTRPRVAGEDGARARRGSVFSPEAALPLDGEERAALEPRGGQPLSVHHLHLELPRLHARGRARALPAGRSRHRPDARGPVDGARGRGGPDSPGENGEVTAGDLERLGGHVQAGDIVL